MKKLYRKVVVKNNAVLIILRIFNKIAINQIQINLIE